MILKDTDELFCVEDSDDYQLAFTQDPFGFVVEVHEDSSSTQVCLSDEDADALAEWLRYKLAKKQQNRGHSG